MQFLIKEFKEGDKVMGIHTDLGYVGLVCGKIVQVERIGFTNIKAMRYIVDGEEQKFSGILDPHEAVEFDCFKWIRVEILFSERKKLLEEAQAKLKIIETIMDNARQ